MLIKPLLPFVEYAVNYDYIKNVLCENKEKPQLECNGKCYLSKELAKASETPDERNNKKQISVETTIAFCQEIENDFNFAPFFYEQKSKIASYNNTSYSYLEVASIFHPPIV